MPSANLHNHIAPTIVTHVEEVITLRQNEIVPESGVGVIYEHAGQQITHQLTHLCQNARRRSTD